MMYLSLIHTSIPALASLDQIPLAEQSEPAFAVLAASLALVAVALILRQGTVPADRSLRTTPASADDAAILRRDLEHHRRLALEANHRLGNHLASLQSLIGLTRERCPDVGQFADTLQARLEAMAQLHRLLCRSRCCDVDLRELLTTLAASAPGASLLLQGPPVRLPARQALPLALALSELLVNCAKHGAHRTPLGRLSLLWEIDAPGPMPTLRIAWRETGGPPPHPAPKPSLGSWLVEGFLVHELGGRCRLAYPPHGATHDLEFPLDPATNAPAPQAHDPALASPALRDLPP